MSYIGKQPTKAPLTASDIEDGIITAAKIEDGTVVAAEIASNAVTTAKINADAVTGAKIADDAINSEHYTDGSVDTAHIADANVTTAKIADDAVTADKINNDIISGSTELASEPADTDEFLVSDAGTLKRIDYSLIKGGGITEADQYRLTADISSNANPITSNFERVDDPSFEKIGSGMSVSSGTWTFPSTGFYQVVTSLKGNSSNGSDSWGIYVNATTNNSSYDTIAQVFMGTTNTDQVSEMSSQINFINVTNTSNVKVRFEAGSISSGSYIEGDTNQNKTTFTFIRLGDSV